ncbi:hypothetical protein WBJ53_10640 [Spirosoma sp. SC4-14]|uniref:hypothetical protein n=1 Tax=Spirosoma sp. SC4-14 TaxID=3128900 RepID=UPI0030D5CE35
MSDIDWNTLDNPDVPQSDNPSGGKTSLSDKETLEEMFIEAGCAIYQKYIDGGYLDSDGIPDLAKAPESLQKKLMDFAKEVEKAGLDVDDIMTKVEQKFS